MKKRLFSVLLALAMVVGTIPIFAAGTAEETEASVTLSAGSRQMEYLNRGGFAATNPTGGIYLSWRLLGSEPMDTVFNIYKNGGLLTANLNNTNYIDQSGTAEDNYTVAPVIDGAEGAQSEAFMKLTGYRDKGFENSPYAYFDIPVNIPPDGDGYTYNNTNYSKENGGPNDASVGDVDGDGEYEVILKWDPSNSKDSASSGVTGIVYIDCYELDGTMLWRIDLGRNIRAGAHYTQFQVFDYDGDGKAEVAMKTAPGSKDGKGNYVSEAGNTEEIRTTDNSKSYLGTNGHVTGGPEYLTIFNGETGVAMQTVDYDPPVGTVRDWGDSNYNRSDRYLAATAYLDGEHPSMIFCRGYYGKSVVAAYDWDGTNLTKLWRLDSTSSSSNDFYGQGNHNLSVADLDGDGCDEIVYGAAAIDNDGTLLWSVKHDGKKLGHGDALHVSDFDNDGEQEIFKVNEDSPNWGRSYIENDGTLTWIDRSTDDDGRGIMDYFSQKYGVLAWDGAIGICTLDRQVISKATAQDNNWSYPNFSIFWDGDLCREHFDGNRISKWYDYETPDDNGNLGGFGRLWNIPGTGYNNTSKKNPCLQADLFGDWREELILRTSDNSALRVFTSLSPTDYKFTTFMHDSQYRCAIAWQNTAYNQPPHQSYYIGYDKDVSEYVQPDIYTKALNPEVKLTVMVDGAPAEGVNVTLSGIEKPTDKNGAVYYRVEAGTHTYKVDQVGYKLAEGTVELTGSAAEQVVNLETVPDSTITVMSGGAPVSGAAVTAGGQTYTTDQDGKAVFKLRAGTQSYSVECHKYISKTGEFEISETGTDQIIELEAVNYEYDSTKDEKGSQFVYTGGEGASLTFSKGEWTFEQNSTDGGREFSGLFKASENGKMTFEMTYNTGGKKDANDAWNWSGRNYTHGIKFLNLYGETILGISQEYNNSGVQEAKYYVGTGSKTNVSSGEVIGGPNITKRSSSTWRIVVDFDFAAKTADLTFTDEAGANGYKISDIAIDSTSFSSVTIGSTATGNVTWGPKIKDVLYYSECLTEATPSTPRPTATPGPTEKPVVSETWDFNNLAAGDTYGTDKTAIANSEGHEIIVNYGTSALSNAVAPVIAERTAGDMYLRFEDMGAGADGWSYEPAEPIDSEKIVFETDFLMGDTAKDTILLRVYDTNNASKDNTYTSSSDGRVFEVKTGSAALKLTDYFSKGDSDTKGKDTDISGFTFAANTWYSLKIEYTKGDNKVKVYTKPDGGTYTLRTTYTLGSGTSKVETMPALALTKVASTTRGSASNVLGIDNISIGVVKQDEPIITPAPNEVAPIGDYVGKVEITKEVGEDSITLTVTPVDGSVDLSGAVMFMAEYSDSAEAITNVNSDAAVVGEDGAITVTAPLSSAQSYKYMLWDKNQSPIIAPITSIE